MTLCTKISLPLLFPSHHLFKIRILPEDLPPPFPPSWDKGFLHLLSLLYAAYLAMSGTSLAERKTALVLRRAVISSLSLFSAEEAV